MTIIEKHATFKPLGDDLHQAAALSIITGKTESEILSAIESVKRLSSIEAEQVFAFNVGCMSDLMPQMVAAGAALPIYLCVTEKLGPLAVIGPVPRIDCPVNGTAA